MGIINRAGKWFAELPGVSSVLGRVGVQTVKSSDDILREAGEAAAREGAEAATETAGKSFGTRARETANTITTPFTKPKTHVGSDGVRHTVTREDGTVVREFSKGRTVAVGAGALAVNGATDGAVSDTVKAVGAPIVSGAGTVAGYVAEGASDTVRTATGTDIAEGLRQNADPNNPESGGLSGLFNGNSDGAGALVSGLINLAKDNPGVALGGALGLLGGLKSLASGNITGALSNVVMGVVLGFIGQMIFGGMMKGASNGLSAPSSQFNQGAAGGPPTFGLPSDQQVAAATAGAATGATTAAPASAATPERQQVTITPAPAVVGP